MLDSGVNIMYDLQKRICKNNGDFDSKILFLYETIFFQQTTYAIFPLKNAQNDEFLE
jgi:hypothetical protein